MKRILTILLAMLTFFCGSHSAKAQVEDPELALLGNGIAAIVEGEIITIEELRREIAPLVPRLRLEARSSQEMNERIRSISREILQNMIDRIIIVKAAEDKGLLLPDSVIDLEYERVIEEDFGGDRGRFLEFLRESGKTTRDFRKDVYREVVVSAMRQENRRSQSEISPEQIDAFYVANKIRFYQEESLHLRQIILSKKPGETDADLQTRVDSVMSALASGTDFSDVAREYSQDEMSRRGGDWGWIERKDIRKELSRVAFDLPLGQYSRPIELGGTFFILYAEEKREEMIQPISEVRDIIENVLVGEISRETQEAWLRDLREDAYIRYFMRP